MIEPIVTADRVSHALQDQSSDIVLADVRWYLDGRNGHAAFLERHLAGARFVDLETVLAGPAGPSVGRHPLPSPEVFAAGLGAAGIGPGTTVVAYDDSGGMTAARLVWMLRILGRPAAVLDGGLDAWSGPTESGPVDVDPVDHPAQPWPESAMASADQVQAHLDSGGVVVDARAAMRYRGEWEPVDPQAGHIPGAINIPFDDLLQDGSLRSDVGDVLREAGLDASSITYCGSGVSSCLGVLAAESTGIGRPRLYVGSWSGWSSEPHRRVETGGGV